MTAGPLGAPRPFIDCKLVLEYSFKRQLPQSSDPILEADIRDSVSQRVDSLGFRDGRYKYAVKLSRHIDERGLNEMKEAVEKSVVLTSQNNNLEGYTVVVEG